MMVLLSRMYCFFLYECIFLNIILIEKLNATGTYKPYLKKTYKAWMLFLCQIYCFYRFEIILYLQIMNR